MGPFAERRHRLARSLSEESLHGFLVTSPVNVTYLAGFTGDSSYLLVGKTETLLVSDGRYAEQLQEECPGLKVHIRAPGQRITEVTGGVIDKLGWRQVGFESNQLTVAEYTKFQEVLPTVAWKPAADTIEKFRIRKDESEIAQLKEAIGLAERAFARFRVSIQPDDTEKQLGDRLEMYLREEGARCGSFPSIVAVGARAALPHAPLSNTKAMDGELILVDWGASGRLYKSDLTRVLAKRTILPKLSQAYEVVLQAQARAIRKIRPGLKAREIDAEARCALEEAGFGEFFSHSLGHGIGLELHEAPSLRPQSETVLEPGMVFTVEPGVYLKGWGGIRIEDDVLVTPDGCEVLTSVTRELQALACDF